MFPYQDLEPGSWEASYDAQAPTCSICGKRLKGRRCYCEAPPVERERLLPVWEPAAVVYAPSWKHPETLWFDARHIHTWALAIKHGRKLARLIQGRCEVV